MDLIKKVLETTEKHDLLSENDCIVVGFSGGPDSLVMMDILLRLRDRYKLALVAVHVNHGLRPGAADEDQAFAEKYCKENNIECRVFSTDCNALAAKTGKSSEEAGRDFRYESFDAVAAEMTGKQAAEANVGKVKIAVAHNANDQAETLLFRFIRGTGVDGLAGMEYSRKSSAGFDIIRPMLDCSREEIEEYVKERDLTPCIDLTNDEPIYARNRLRLKALPKIKETFNPNIVETLSRLAMTAQEDKDYMWNQAYAVYDMAFISATLQEIDMDLAIIQGAHPAIRHRIIEIAFAKIGLETDIGRVHLEAADEIISKGQTGTETNFPHGYVLTVAYGKLVARRASADFQAQQGSEDDMLAGMYSVRQIDDTRCDLYSAEAAHKRFVLVTVTGPLRSIDIRLSLPAGADGFKTEGNTEIPTCPLGRNAAPVKLRTRRDGDYIVFKSQGKMITKKIQDFFTDSKIPAYMRDSIPLLCFGREVLLVLGDDVTGLRTGLERSRYTGNYR